MHKLYEIHFVSSNNHKFLEAKKILKDFDINLKFLKSELVEIQSNSLIKIAQEKAKTAFSKFKKPLLIEDDGLFIKSLEGFPGPYSSYVFKTIGNKGILDLLKNNRRAHFISIITYCDKSTLKSFEGKLDGTISKTQKGKGWGYDPIFIPNNSKKTFAETSDKNELSHRYLALKKFSKWYLQK